MQIAFLVVWTAYVSVPTNMNTTSFMHIYNSCYNSSSKFASSINHITSHHIMALFATRYLRLISSRSQLSGPSIKIQRAFISTSTTKNAGAKLKSRADLFPIYILLGFTGRAVFLAVRSVTAQLVHHPGVQVNKSNRSMVPEVDSPELTLASGDKFISKSVLRKGAHIQKNNDAVHVDGTPDIYSQRSSDSTNLKTVGVQPRSNRG